MKFIEFRQQKELHMLHGDWQIGFVNLPKGETLITISIPANITPGNACATIMYTKVASVIDCREAWEIYNTNNK